MFRSLPLWVVIGLAVLTVTSPGSAGMALVQVPVIATGPVIFVTSGFCSGPLIVRGFGMLSPVIIQPVIIRPVGAERVVASTVGLVPPRRVVILSPLVPVGAPIPFLVPSMVPVAPMGVDSSPTLPPIELQTVTNVARAPELFDHHLVAVTGNVSSLHTFSDAQGQEGTLMQLKEDWYSITILAQGHVDARRGVLVHVTGAFFASGSVLAAPTHNMLVALVVTGS